MKTTNVGLAEWRISRDPAEALCALGLGSAVGLFLYDPAACVAAVAHVMLPSGRGDDGKPAKYAVTAVPFLVDELVKAGAEVERLKVGLFGGATLMAMGNSSMLQVGNRNVSAMVEALGKCGLTANITDVGGTRGRSVVMDVGTGYVTVKVLSQPDRVLTELRPDQEVAL